MLNGKKIIALCLPRINDSDCHKLITSMQKCLPSPEWRLMVFATSTDLFWRTSEEAGQAAVFDLINYDITDAIVIFDEKIKDPNVVHSIIGKTRARGKLCIVIGKEYEDTVRIGFSYDKGFEEMVKHVIDVHKARRVHMIAGIKGNEYSDVRIGVFAKVLHDRGIQFDRSMVSYGDFWSDPTKAAVEKLIARGNLPEALICANDSMAIAAAQTLIDHGVKVPEDVIVTGFDGIDDIKFSIPRITSCECSYERLAQGICGIINESEAGRSLHGEYYVMPSLILSESCGCRNVPPINAADQLFDVNNRFYRYQEEEYTMYKMSSRFLTCETFEDATKFVDKANFYDMHLVIHKAVNDSTKNPTVRPDGPAYGDTALQIYTTDAVERRKHVEFPVKFYLPDIDAVLHYNVPIIFYGLNVIDVPIGYVVFHFHNLDIGNYIKVPQVVNAFNNAIGGLRNMRYQRYINWQIEEMYKLDNLTGLYNRNGFIREYRRMISANTDHDHKLTVVLTDLDGLKHINDKYGHDEGDNAIRASAHALRDACPEGTLCLRFGGDEMLGVYNGVLDEKTLREEYNKKLAEYNASSGKPYSISASLGMYVLSSSDAEDLDELIKKSDKLMYFNKKNKQSAPQES